MPPNPSASEPYRSPLLYGRGQVGHARKFAQLNGELTAWDPSKESPNRLDALVHGLRELLGIRPRKSNIGKVLD